MALPSSGVWEVRSDTGIDTNGGMFNPSVTSPGTDYTYPTSAPISYTDLAAPTVTTLTSTARPFIAADNGNTVKTTANGYFAITSVSGGTATGVWSGTAPTAGTTGISGTLGGALATPAAYLSAMATSNDGWLRDNGTYFDVGTGLTASVASVTPSATVKPHRLMGYGTTRGDAGRATLKLTSGSVKAPLTLSNSGWYLSNLILDANAQSLSSALKPNGAQAVNCKFLGSRNTCVEPGTGSSALMLDRCELTGHSGASVLHVGTFGESRLTNCWVHDNTCSGPVLRLNNDANSSGLRTRVTGCLFSNNTNDNIACSAGAAIEGNTFYQTGGAGVMVYGAGLSDVGTVRNNIFAKCGTYGLTSDAAFAQGANTAWDGNAYWGNTTGDRSVNVGASLGAYDVALTADPFVSAVTNDFRLNNTAGGGASLRGAGCPSALPGLPSAANARDMGAYQHATPALGLTVNTSGTNPVLTWAADPRVVTGYVILRGATASALAEIATVGSGTTTYTDASVSSGTYVYSVASY